MDLQAFYAAASVTVRAAAEAAGGVAEPKLPPKAAVLLRFDVQQAVGLDAADAAARLPLHVGKSLGAAAVGMADKDSRASGGGSLARGLICPECGKAFPSDKAMYGHLRSHPERGYKGSSRPGTPATAGSAAAGVAKPRKVPPRKEAPELSTMTWPVTARRGRTPTIATSPVSADPAAVLLREPPAPLLLEAARGVEPVPLQLVEPPHGVEPAVLLLEPRRSEEEDAAFTLLDLYQQMRGEAPEEQEDTVPMQQMQEDNPVEEHQEEQEDALPMQQMQVDNPVEEHQMPRPDPDQLEAPADHVAHASHHAPVEHIFGIIVGSHAAAEAEQSNAIAQASKGKGPMEPVSSSALVMFRDKILSPGASKRPKKRPLPDQSLAAADAAEVSMPPPLRRIPSPASDRKFVCPHESCAKKFPTHQALGGHMANHNRANRCAPAQNMDGLAAAHAVNNIMLHHQLRQGVLPGEGVLPPVPRAPKTHSCSRCNIPFPTGQALGGHMRKHWLVARGSPGTSLAVPISNAVALAVAPAVPAIAVQAVPVEAPSAPGNAMAVLAAAPAAPANALALALPIAAPPEPNGEPGGFEFDLNEMPME